MVHLRLQIRLAANKIQFICLFFLCKFVLKKKAVLSSPWLPSCPVIFFTLHISITKEETNAVEKLLLHIFLIIKNKVGLFVLK